MTSHPDLHHRRSLRLQGYDYGRAGAYFVTLCTHGRDCLFGEIVEGAMRPNDAGAVVADEWFKTAQIRNNVHLNADEFVLMPNHMHGILWLTDAGRLQHDVGATRRVAPTTPRSHPDAPASGPASRPTGPAPGSVGAIIAQFKSVVTKRINALHCTSGARVWQRNYHEHIIRDDESLNRIREYIVNNPMKWALDRENPANAARIRQEAGRSAGM